MGIGTGYVNERIIIIGYPLTLSSHKTPSLVHEVDLVVVEARQGTQIMVTAFFGERVDASIAVVEMGKQDIGP